MLQADELVGAWRNSPVAAVPPSEVVLVTDFDGTLADIVPDPAQTVARSESLQALSRLVRQLADVIVLSSRTHEQLEALVPISGVRLIGDSGLAIPRHAHKEALDRFNSDVAVLLEGIPGAWLEAKPASSAVHFRNTSLSGEEVLALLQPLIRNGRSPPIWDARSSRCTRPRRGREAPSRPCCQGKTPAASCAAETTRTTARCSST